jgi:hypothetical protein
MMAGGLVMRNISAEAVVVSVIHVQAEARPAVTPVTAPVHEVAPVTTPIHQGCHCRALAHCRVDVNRLLQ